MIKYLSQYKSQSFDHEVTENGAQTQREGNRCHHETGCDLLEVFSHRLGPEHHGHVGDVSVGEREEDHDQHKHHVVLDQDLSQMRAEYASSKQFPFMASHLCPPIVRGQVAHHEDGYADEPQGRQQHHGHL